MQTVLYSPMPAPPDRLSVCRYLPPSRFAHPSQPVFKPFLRLPWVQTLQHPSNRRFIRYPVLQFQKTFEEINNPALKL
jgi:hypothetical protein